MSRTYLDLESKTKEALETFQELRECTYSRRDLGSLGQYETMTCDCVEEWDGTKNRACSEDSGCINRATSVECVEGQSGCGSRCSNQRFQLHQFAQITVIDAGKKGYGVRSDSTLEEGDFIYEYIGEVIDEKSFRERMNRYDEQKFRHFYFMMLKKDSFIDATIKGSLARFCNHLCNPNAYVDKWVVGDKLRMGIFAKRHIEKGEEITFDYNVDRYGAQLQPCYCGEPNCLKFMGGKTQTDSALLLPDGVAEALGITPAQERAWLRENKHLRTKQQEDDAIINEAFVRLIPVLSLQLTEVLKVMGALMKLQDKYVVEKLLARIKTTTDASINSLIIRVHGYKTMSHLLQEYNNSKDYPMVSEILNILLQWPRITKNKILSLQIEDVVQDIEVSSKDETIRQLLKSLLEEWGALQMAYRIPKNELPMTKHSRLRSPERRERSENESPERSLKSPNPPVLDADLPDGWEMAFDEATQLVYYYHQELGILRWERPTRALPKGPQQNQQLSSSVMLKGDSQDRSKDRDRTYSNGKLRERDGGMYAREEERLKLERQQKALDVQEKDKLLQQVILQLQQEAETKRLEAEKIRLEELEAKERERKRRKLERSKLTSETHASTKNKPGRTKQDQWVHIFAKYVPNFVRHHEKDLGHDNIKGCSKDIVKILAEKETKKDKEASVPEKLDSHKQAKVRSFCDSYMDKVIAKRKNKHH